MHAFFTLYSLFTASQVKNLVRILPLAIGEYIPEDDQHWLCFLLFWDICNMALSFAVMVKDAGHLAWTVEAFVESFKSLYLNEASITPKMHQLVHLPEQIIR